MKKIKPVWRPQKVDKHLLPLKRDWQGHDIRRLQARLRLEGIDSVYLRNYHALYVSNRRKARAALQELATEGGSQ